MSRTVSSPFLMTLSHLISLFDIYTAAHQSRWRQYLHSLAEHHLAQSSYQHQDQKSSNQKLSPRTEILHTDYKSSEVWVIPPVLRLVRAALKTRNDHQGCVAWPGLALTRKNNILNSLDNVTAADTHDTDDDDDESWRKLARLDSDDDSVGAAATDDNVVTNQQDISKSVSGAHNNDDDSPQLIVHTASADNIVTVQILSSYQLLISLMKTWTTWKEQSISMSKLN